MTASTSAVQRIPKTTKEQPYESRGVPLGFDDVLAILEEDTKLIMALTKALPAPRLQKAPVLGVWSTNDVLAHLRACSDARGEFMRAMLAEKRPTLRAINPRSLLEKTDYRELPFPTSLRAFTRQRARLLSFLTTLPRESWSRTAIVTGGGPPRERTVLFYGAWLAGHERAHVRTLARALRHEP